MGGTLSFARLRYLHTLPLSETQQPSARQTVGRPPGSEMPIGVGRPGVLSASHSLGRRLGSPLTACFWDGVAADDGWSADLAHNMHATLRLMLEKERHSAEEMSTALARASSLTENGHAGLRACARALYEMSENACCVLCARTTRAPTLPLTLNPVHGFGTCSVKYVEMLLRSTWP